MHAPVVARSECLVSSSVTLHCIFETGSLTELIHLGWLDEWQALDIYPPLPPQHWHYRRSCHTWLFTQVLGG